MSYVDGDFVLATDKEDQKPITGLAKFFWRALDANLVAQAASDLRDSVLAILKLSRRRQVNIASYTSHLDGSAFVDEALAAAFADASTVIIDPGVTLKFANPIVLAAGQALIGDPGHRPRLMIEHGGVGIDFSANESHARDLVLLTNSQGGVYTGLRFRHNTVHLHHENIGVYYAGKAFVVQGESDFNTCRGFSAMWCDTSGIEFESYSGYIGSGNVFQFNELIGPGPADLHAPADHGTGIICTGGAGANQFIGGSVGLWQKPIVQDGTYNTFTNLDAEHFAQGPELSSGVSYWDSHLYLEGAAASGAIDPSARLVGRSGLDCTDTAYIPQPEVSWEGLKGAWLFNEGSGAKYALDYSGRNKLIQYRDGTTWLTGGLWGPRAKIDYSANSGPYAVPTDVLDFTQPWSVVICLRVDDVYQNAFPLSFVGGGHYTRLVDASGYVQLQDYNGTDLAYINVGCGYAGFGSGNNGRHTLVMYFDPSTHSLHSRDACTNVLKGQTLSRAFTVTSPSEIAIGCDALVASKGIKDGSIFAMYFFQREIKASEGLRWSNMQQPLLPPAANPWLVASAPATTGDPGVKGQYFVSTTGRYDCVATDTWTFTPKGTFP